MNMQEIKDLTEKAYGKPITFTPRHWTLYEWVREQPGTSLRDKLYGVVKAAYVADYTKRGWAASARYWDLLCKFDPDNAGEQIVIDEMLHELSDAIECYNRAGNEAEAVRMREMLYAVTYQKQKRAA